MYPQIFVIMQKKSQMKCTFFKFYLIIHLCKNLSLVNKIKQLELCISNKVMYIQNMASLQKQLISQ